MQAFPNFLMLQQAHKLRRPGQFCDVNITYYHDFCHGSLSQLASNVALNTAPDSLVVILVGVFLDTSGLGFAGYANVIAWASRWR